MIPWEIIRSVSHVCILFNYSCYGYLSLHPLCSVLDDDLFDSEIFCHSSESPYCTVLYTVL